MIGTHPPFRRRPGALYIEVALTALAFSLPMAAGAQTPPQVEINGTDVTGSLTSHSYSVFNSGYYWDPLMIEAPTQGAALVPEGASTPRFSGQRVVITDWAPGTHYSVAGGGVMSGSNDVTNNWVTINGSTTDILGKVIGGVSADTGKVGGSASEANIVILNDGTVGNDVIGGVGSGAAITEISYNEVRMTGGTAETRVSGAWSVPDDSNNYNNAGVHHNKVTITGGTVGDGSPTPNNGNVYGGVSQLGDAYENSVAITSGASTKIHGRIVGGFAENESGTGNPNALGNTVTVTGGTVDIGGGIEGGYVHKGNGNATKNSVTIDVSDGGSIGGVIYGGRVAATGSTGLAGGTSAEDGNTVSIANSGGTLTVNGSIYGGYTTSGAAQNNQVTISGDVAAGNVYGGYVNSGTGTASNNTVNISGGTFSGAIVGGRASSSGTASDNTVNISGGIFNGNVTGGVGSTVTDNIVNISGGTFNANVIGGAGGTGNTLNIKASGLSFGGLSGFQNINFYLPSTYAAGDPAVLTVTGTANIANANVNVGISGFASPLKVGDSVTLIDASAGTLTGAPVNPTANGQGLQGVTMKYEFDLDSTTTANQLVATVTKAGVAEAAKSLSEGYLSGQALLAQGADFILSKGFAATRTALAGSAGRPEVFAALGGGRLHHQTGSSVAVKGYTLVTGLAAGKKLDAGEITAAAFIEYGDGDYDSYNSVSGGKVKGKGDTGYRGLGVLAHYRLASGLSFEASARAGRVETDYRSNDLRDASGVRARYDAKSTYTSAHIGVGKSWALNTANQLETYAKGIWTRQASDTVRLSTGDRLEFDATDSKRLRIGARITHAVSSGMKAYAGLAYDREFDGEARATTQGQKIDAPKLKGNTGIAEVGLTATPSAGKPFFLDVGIQGYAGKREGVTGSLRVNYFF